ncbi:MAG: hypothetical protein VYB80_04340 [Actinomycetota bacterium]|nr:hypothetical protein [Actinomycetota bacterium]
MGEVRLGQIEELLHTARARGTKIMRIFKGDHLEDDHRPALLVDQNGNQDFLLRALLDLPRESQEVDVLADDRGDLLRGLSVRKRVDVDDDKKNFNLWMLRLTRQKMPLFLKVK